MPKRARRADRAPTAAVKRRIWDPRVRAMDVDDRMSADTPTGVRVRGVRERADVDDARRAATRELALFRGVKRARSALQRIARARTGRTETPLLLYERWLARCAVSGALAAPVLPAQGLGLAKDLIRHGASERDGAEGAAEALAVAKESAARWAEATRRRRRGARRRRRSRQRWFLDDAIGNRETVREVCESTSR